MENSIKPELLKILRAGGARCGWSTGQGPWTAHCRLLFREKRGGLSALIQGRWDQAVAVNFKYRGWAWSNSSGSATCPYWTSILKAEILKLVKV